MYSIWCCVKQLELNYEHNINLASLFSCISPREVKVMSRDMFIHVVKRNNLLNGNNVRLHMAPLLKYADNNNDNVDDDVIDEMSHDFF